MNPITLVSIDNINSAGIVGECRTMGFDTIKFFGAFLPLEPLPNTCDADATIRIYRLPNGVFVADTSGDPVWQPADAQAWAELMAEYGCEQFA